MQSKHHLNPALQTLAVLTLLSGMHAQTLYGVGTAGTGGSVPRIWAAGTPFPGNSSFKLTLDEAGGRLPRWIAVGLAPAAIPFLGIQLNVALRWPAFVGLTSGTFGQADGSLELPLPIPNQPSLKGGKVYLQWVIFDAQGPQGLAASRGLEIRVGETPLVITCGSQGRNDPIYAVDPRSGTVTNWVSTVGADNPNDVQFTPNGDVAVITAALSRGAYIIDANNGGARLGFVRTSNAPNASAITPDGKRCYVIVAGPRGGVGSIIEIDMVRGSATFATQIGSVSGMPSGSTQLEGVGISANGKVLTASNLGLGAPPMLLVVDIDKSSPNFNKVTRTIRSSGWLTDFVPTSDGSLGIAVAGGLTRNSTLYVYDLRTGLPIKIITTLGAFATDVDLGPHDEFAYVSLPNSNSVSRVGVDPKRPSYGTIVTSPTTLMGAFAVALSPDATKIYTAESRADKMYELDAKTLQILQTFTIGRSAGVAISAR